jgi:hypothetical protein
MVERMTTEELRRAAVLSGFEYIKVLKLTTSHAVLAAAEKETTEALLKLAESLGEDINLEAQALYEAWLKEQKESTK